jgi:lactate permease
VWIQTYDPVGDWRVSTLIAALPILVLLGLLVSGRASAWQAALAGLCAAWMTAVLVFRMPVGMASGAAVMGVVFALFRIVWLIVAAVFLYDLAVETGQFEVMKASIAQLSGDRRIQAILVAFSFGAFVEGAAGFGAPVAISAAFLVGLGFDRFQAAILCLIANTAPVAWGAIGTPIKTLGGVTGLDVEALSVAAGRILPPISFIIPAWLVCTMAGWRATLEIWPVLLAVGGTFAGVQWAWSNYVGVDLVDIASAVLSLVAGIVVLRFWRPQTVWLFEVERAEPARKAVRTDVVLEGRGVLRAWTPFAILTVMVLLWGLPPVKTVMDAWTSWNPEVPGLHRLVAKGEAVTGNASPVDEDLETATLPIVPISSTGTAVFVAALLSSLVLGVAPARVVRIFAGTLRRLVPAMATIFAMLALGFVTKYSGMDAVLGLAFTRTGPMLYPIFGTLLGWLGVALTGSDTSSNVLFGNLQRITAQKLGLNPILMASANSSGGVMGKMIDAQSIVVAAAATNEGGKEGLILRAVFWHSLLLALLVGVVVWLYAHVAGSLIPIVSP